MDSCIKIIPFKNREKLGKTWRKDLTIWHKAEMFQIASTFVLNCIQKQNISAQRDLYHLRYKVHWFVLGCEIFSVGNCVVSVRSDLWPPTGLSFEVQGAMLSLFLSTAHPCLLSLDLPQPSSSAVPFANLIQPSSLSDSSPFYWKSDCELTSAPAKIWHWPANLFLIG